MIRNSKIGPMVRNRPAPSRLIRKRSTRKQSRSCPHLEQLEDRTTPSVTSVFELDANVDTASTHDWDEVFDGTSGALAASFVTDAVNSNTDDIFTGGGSKDTQGIQDGQWLFTDSKPQAKNDITHAYAAAYTDPSNGHLLLYVGLDRFDNSGDATVGFWFFGNQIGLNPDVTQNGGHPFVGEHSDGDILLVSDFTQGGSTSTIKVFQWVGNDSSGSLVPVADVPNSTFAIVNGSAISVPWPYTNKSGQSQPAAGEFFEGGVDLTALGLHGCFSTFLAETRSSQSPTATLSDFVLGSFPLCSIAAPQFTGLSKVGDDVTYPLTVQNTGAFPLHLQSITDSLLGNIVVNGVVQQPGAPGVNPFVTAIVPVGLSPDGSLAPGAILTILVTRTVQPGDPDPTFNTVSFVYNDEADFSGDEVSASVTDSVNLFQPSAAMTVTASPDTATSLGQVITYTYTVNNTSSTDSPNLVLDASPNNSFTDSLLGNLESDAIAAGGGSVAPGGSFNFTETRAIQAGDPTPLVNTATVAFSLAQNLGSFPNIITAQSSASVTLLPHLVIVKAVTDGVDVIHPGDTASFTITVTNDGAGPATNVVVTDQLPEADLLAWGVASSSNFDTAALNSTDFLTAVQNSLAAGASATVTVSAAIPADLFGGTPAGGTGNLPSGPFELDGNALNDPAVAGDDWSNAVFGNGGSSFAHSFVTDAVNSQGDDIFTGGGSKDTQGIQNGPWLFTDSKPQAKNDITHAYAAMYTDPSNGHVILYAGLDRFDNSGDATVGFWFFTNPIGLSTNNPTSSGSPFTGTHADGDILLVSDFTQGGSTSTIQVYRWTGNDSSGSLVPVVTPAGTTFAIVNGASIDVPWSFTDKSHNSDPAAGEFFEGGVDLTALGLGSCFSNFLAETRSSQSETATLSDFVIGNFNTCRLDLPNTATVEADGIDPITSNQVVITILDGDALQAESLGNKAVTEGLSAEQVRSIVAQAFDGWRAAGVDPHTLNALQHTKVHVGNLPRAELGFALPGEIWIDRTAAGWGWSTTGDPGRMDLVTVVTHELGHVLRLEHSDEGVMEARLTPGVRLLPEAPTSTGNGVAPTTSATATIRVVPAGDVALLAAVGAFLDGTSTRGSRTGALSNLVQQTAPVPSTVSAGPAGDFAHVRTPSAYVESGSAGAAAADDVGSDKFSGEGRPPRLNPVAKPVDPETEVQSDAMLWLEACDACFADESWMAEMEEYADQLLTQAESSDRSLASGPVLASAVMALGVLGGHWAGEQTVSRKRRRFVI